MQNPSFHKRPKPLRFGLRHKMLVWWKGRVRGPKYRGETLPLGTLESPVAQIHHWTERRLQRIVAIWGYDQHSIPVAMEQVAIALNNTGGELSRREKNLSAHLDRYKKEHDGLEPAGSGRRIAQLCAFWTLGVLFAVGEWPLMSAALERLPLPDWQRFIATAGASGVTIYLAHQIGVWFAKPAKTIGQTLFGWFLVAILATILTAAAIVRRDAVKEHLKSPVTTPEVRSIQPKGERSFHV